VNTVTLREKIEGEELVTYTMKPELRALKCECCGKVFQMQPYCNDSIHPAIMTGIFDRMATGEDGRGLGNMFEATVCSFACADTVFVYGWKELDRYLPYLREGAELVRVQLGLTTSVVEEPELVQAWEAQSDLKYGESRYHGVKLVTEAIPR